ncbi:copper resistance CopC family protein [Aurantimicrobium minutum]|uniref:copper resistance CopC family protein n=1 Tax=Aurantimicrobium minutum TaxID=708131 RepID=UPI002476D9F5|nr:copper resistance protein CopC [Aurantimicrobium minutum]MDH6423707.1 methionine-rich copper-binding protein CopC [Aurantimicrobium minutum]
MIRRIGAALVALVFAVGFSCGTAQMASAHSDSFQSVPADDSTVTTPVTEIQFTFVEPVNAELSPPEVVLVNQDGIAAELGAPILDETGATMTVQILSGALPNGDYTASYRIVSQDGHPASGELFFAVEGSDAPALVAADADADTDAIAEADSDVMVTSSGSGNDTQLQLVLGLSAAGAVVLAGVLVLVSLRRRRNSQAK